jgi:hypothetical protein
VKLDRHIVRGVESVTGARLAMFGGDLFVFFLGLDLRLLLQRLLF